MAYTYGSVTNCKVRNGQTRNEYECRLGYEVQSQSIENNTSNITLRLECRSISSSYTTKGSSGLTSVIDGTTVKSNASVDMSNTNTWQNFGERTITVTHNADGSYSASKSGSFTCTAGSSNYSLASGSASVTVAPATIPRASTPTLSASSVAMGSSVTITTNRASDSFTHTLTYSFGSASGTIASSVGASTTWTPPLSLASQIPSATSGTCTITCQTYNGSTLIGTKTVTLTLTVPSSVVPSISSIALSEAGSAIPSSWGVYVQGKSTLKVVTSASGSYGSGITSYKVTGIDNNTYYSSNFTSSILQSSGTKTITVTVTDSRGRTATKTTTYTCVAYSNPSITTATVTRCNSDGTANEEGTYVKYSFKANVASISSKNTYSYKLGYKNSTSSSYTYITISNSSYTLDKSNAVISGVTFSADNSYDFHFLVTDYFTKSEKTVALGTGFTLMDFNASGKGMAIGKVSEKDALEVGIDSYFGRDSCFNKKVILTDSPPNFGGCKYDTVVSSYVKLFTHVMTAQWKTSSTWFVLSDTQSGNENALCSLWIYRGETTTKVIGFNCLSTKSDFDVSRLAAVVINDTTVEVYCKMTTSDSPTISILSQTKMVPTNDAYGKITIDCNTTVSALPSGTATNPQKLIMAQKTLSTKSHTGYGTNNNFLVDVSMLSFWNGAYDSSNSSNLTYCQQGTIQAKPVVAYSNLSGGTSGTVTMSKNVSDYNHISITYRNDDNQYSTSTLSAINKFSSFTTYGTIIRKNGDNSAVLINSALFTVSGNTITISRNSQANMFFSDNDNATDNNVLYITKVELWN